MNLFHHRVLKRIVFVFFVCITFFSYRLIDFCADSSSTLERSIDQELNQTISETGSMDTEKIIGDDKGSLTQLLIKVVVLFLFRFFFSQQFFLFVKRWLIKTNIILEYNIPFIFFVHKKDGKKKCCPS